MQSIKYSGGQLDPPPTWLGTFRSVSVAGLESEQDEIYIESRVILLSPSMYRDSGTPPV